MLRDNERSAGEWEDRVRQDSEECEWWGGVPLSVSGLPSGPTAMEGLRDLLVGAPAPTAQEPESGNRLLGDYEGDSGNITPNVGPIRQLAPTSPSSTADSNGHRPTQVNIQSGSPPANEEGVELQKCSYVQCHGFTLNALGNSTQCANHGIDFGRASSTPTSAKNEEQKQIARSKKKLRQAIFIATFTMIAEVCCLPSIEVSRACKLVLLNTPPSVDCGWGCCRFLGYCCRWNSYAFRHCWLQH